MHQSFSFFLWLHYLYSILSNLSFSLLQFASPCGKKISESKLEDASHSPDSNDSSNDNNDSNELGDDATLDDDEELLAQSAVSNGHNVTAAEEDEEEQIKLENFKQRLKDELVTRDGHE